jgi:3-dehydroquinate synthase
MRGISYIQIPTSILAMVVSAIGGKVGVDTPFVKNLVGTFHHPEAVIIDIDFLKKLPQDQLKNGLMEAVKIFLTYDKSYFELVQKNWKKILKKDLALLQRIISRAVELKIGVVERDEHEANERMVVNWGHTIGHAIEQLSNYKYGHGICVALGILVESKIAELLGVLTTEDFENIRSSMQQFGIDAKILKTFSTAKIIRQTLIDKKSRNGKTKYVLLENIGQVKTEKGKFGHEVDKKTVEKALNYFIK